MRGSKLLDPRRSTGMGVGAPDADADGEAKGAGADGADGWA